MGLFTDKAGLGAYLPKSGQAPPNPILKPGTYAMNDYEPNTELVIGNGNDTLTGVILQGTNNTIQLTIKDGVDITFDNVSINQSTNDGKCAVSIDGASTITLKDGSTNIIQSGTNKAGIYVAKSKTLILDGTGTLNVFGGKFGAGIGAGYADPTGGTCGTVIINNGTITAKGGVKPHVSVAAVVAAIIRVETEQRLIFPVVLLRQQAMAQQVSVVVTVKQEETAEQLIFPVE